MDNTGAGRLWTQHSEENELPYYFHAAILFFGRFLHEEQNRKGSCGERRHGSARHGSEPH